MMPFLNLHVVHRLEERENVQMCSRRQKRHFHPISPFSAWTWLVTFLNHMTCSVLKVFMACFFTGVPSKSLCLRRSRIKWRSGLGFDDDAPLVSFLGVN